MARDRRAHRRIGKRAERPQAASARPHSRHIIALELSRLAEAECALEFQASQGRPTQRQVGCEEVRASRKTLRQGRETPHLGGASLACGSLRVGWLVTERCVAERRQDQTQVLRHALSICDPGLLQPRLTPLKADSGYAVGGCSPRASLCHRRDSASRALGWSSQMPAGRSAARPGQPQATGGFAPALRACRG